MQNTHRCHHGKVPAQGGLAGALNIRASLHGGGIAPARNSEEGRGYVGRQVLGLDLGPLVGNPDHDASGGQKAQKDHGQHGSLLAVEAVQRIPGAHHGAVDGQADVENDDHGWTSVVGSVAGTMASSETAPFVYVRTARIRRVGTPVRRHWLMAASVTPKSLAIAFARPASSSSHSSSVLSMAANFSTHLSSAQAFAYASVEDSRMTSHNLKRGVRLRDWIKRNGGAAICLKGAGYEPGSDAYKSRMTRISQAKTSLSHDGALRFEREFAVLGMPAGHLTNNLDDDGDGRGHRTAEPPADAAFTRVQHYTAKTLPEQVDRPFPYISTDALFSWSSWGVLLDVDPADRTPRDGSIYLARTVGGTPVVGQCRMTTSGFELLVGAAAPLDSTRHISEIVGRCTHIGADLP